MSEVAPDVVVFLFRNLMLSRRTTAHSLISLYTIIQRALTVDYKRCAIVFYTNYPPKRVPLLRLLYLLAQLTPDTQQLF